MAPTQESLQSSSQSYMDTIKAKVHEENMNRRDRKARRLKALTEQQNKLEVQVTASDHSMPGWYL